jgi:L-lactate utilization protein LutC
LLREISGGLPAGTMHWMSGETTARDIEPLSASLITVEAVLADTGSCVVFCPTAVSRLLCYLPPACVVVARKSQLFEHLPAAWPAITKTCTDKNIGGEIVIVTGPSRTADIE